MDFPIVWGCVYGYYVLLYYYPRGYLPCIWSIYSNNTTNNDNTYEVTVCARCHRGDPADLQYIVPWGKYLYPVYVLLLLLLILLCM